MEKIEFGEENYKVPHSIAELANDLRKSFGNIIHITEGDYSAGCSSLAITFQKCNHKLDENKDLYIWLFEILEILNTGDSFWNISVVKMSRIVYLTRE